MRRPKGFAASTNALKLIAGAVLLTVSCPCRGDPGRSTKSLIERYKVATCLPFSVKGNARIWDTVVSCSDGSKINVKAMGLAGGKCTVIPETTHQSFVAAAPGDYIYPYDIRVDIQNDLLYILARGLAGGIWERILLFEYDLRQHRQTERRRIREADVPERCAEGRNPSK